jgi:tetratricopeptide (TPR) repeat protein
LGESYFELGETGKAEALYRDWLQADPCWGWGWIGWSDGYGFTRTQLQDWGRAEQILREGLAVDQVRDRLDMLERLADVCEEQGRKGEATELRKEAKRASHREPPNQRSGAMSRARAGAGKSTRSAAAPETCRPPELRGLTLSPADAAWTFPSRADSI